MLEDERRLSAILAADVVGYTKRMEQDTEGTVKAWKSARTSIVDPTISNFSGRIVKHTGDGFLAEFNTVLDAVNCAVEMQAALASSVLKFRMGINLGDIIDDGEDIHGEGVNLAARIEALADPGGISISGVVYEQVFNRLDYRFEDMGKVEVKHVARPVQVYRIVLAGVADLVTVQDLLIPAELKRDNTIAIAEFENLSSDTEMGFFCESLAEDLAAALGNIAQLTVVTKKHGDSSDNSMTGNPDKTHYLLSGKVRYAGNRIRISANLIDSQTGVQRWADRFDHQAGDLFDIQDAVVRNIVIGVHTELGAGAYTNQWQWGTENLEAWQLMAQGFREFQKFSPDSFAKTANYWEQALAKDPDYLAPLMGNGYCYSYLALASDGKVAEDYITRALANYEQAIAKAPMDVRVYSAKRGLEIARGDYKAAVEAAETALAMEPQNAACRGTLAMTLMCADRPRDALAHGNKSAHEMSDPPGWLSMVQILSNFMLGNIDEAIRISRKTVTRVPDFYPGPVLAAALASVLEQMDEAKSMRDKVLKDDPQFSGERFIRTLGLKNGEIRKKLFDALIDAGLPG
jgi:adenylate cyclase